MTLTTPNMTKLLAPLVAFAVALATLLALNGGAEELGAQERAAEAPGYDPSTRGRIAQARAAIAADPLSAAAYTGLGSAQFQLARETGDPRGKLIPAAERNFTAALRRDPASVEATVGLGQVALGGHDFRRGLRLGRRALRLEPDLVRAYPVIVDGLIELGRYDQAGRALQRMIDLKPNLASYARVSYYRELRGDLDGALQAMRFAVSAGGDAVEQVAYVQTLLGDLQLDRGSVGAARAAYRLALTRLPGYVDARFGLARAAVAETDFPVALPLLRDVVADRPDPDHLLLLAEVEAVLGHDVAARRHVARARAVERAALAAGAHPDAGVVLLEAEHGDLAAAVRLGRRVWRAAPSVTAADALGWALTRAGRPAAGLRFAHRALRLGSRSSLFHHHAGVAALRSGRKTAARRHLATALRLNSASSPRAAQKARRLLGRLAQPPV